MHSDRFLQQKLVGIFLRSGYFHPEGAVSRTIPMEDTQYKLHFADMIPKSNHIGFTIKQYVKATLRQHDVTQNKLDFSLK